jgi:hypothetical protein
MLVFVTAVRKFSGTGHENKDMKVAAWGWAVAMVDGITEWV